MRVKSGNKQVKKDIKSQAKKKITRLTSQTKLKPSVIAAMAFYKVSKAES